MTDIRLYLVQVENNNQKEATGVAQKAAQRLQNKELRLVELIESFGEYINHENSITRERTMSFLAEVLAATPNGVLPGQHRNLLLDFVISRIEDHEVGVGSCAKALLALEERGQWDAARAQRVLSTLLENTHPLIRAGSHSQRHPVLLLLDLLVAKYRPALLELHQTDSTFLPRFISYFDGEKDPRNLMIVFSILAVVMTEWDVSASVQDVFDAAFNYFPITFRPPPDDTYNITAQDLKTRLKNCIASNSSFAPYAYPALLDKLDSTSLNTKRDVLQALYSTALSYGPKTIALYSVTLWDALKFEILQVQEEDLAQESLKVLAALGVSLTRGTRDGLLAFLRPIVKECNEHLEDAPTKQSDAACRILYSIASVSPDACNTIVSGTLPHLFTLYQTTRDVPKRRSLIQALSQLIQASCEVFGDWNTVPGQSNADTGQLIIRGKSAHNALHQFSGQAFELLTDVLTSLPIQAVSFRLSILDATLQLSKAREVLKADDISQFIRMLNDIILNEESYGKDEAKMVATNCLVEVARQKPQLVIDHSFPAFLSKLPDTDVNHPKKYVPILEAFSKLGIEGNIFNTVVVRLRNKLNTAISQNASTTYIQAILSALLYTFSHAVTTLEGKDDYCPYYKDLILPLLTATLENLGPDRQDDLTLTLIGRLSNEVLRHQNSTFQSSIASQVFTLSLQREPSEAPPFNSSASPKDCQHIIISMFLLAALHKEVQLHYDLSSLTTSLIRMSSRTDVSAGTKSSSLQTISLIVNKFYPSTELKPALKPIIANIIKPGDGLGLEEGSIRVIFAILKALILRNAPFLNDIFPTLLAALDDPQTGLSVAHGFSALLQPDAILTKDNHCVISALHRQKTFSILVPEIIRDFKNAKSEVKKNYLVALSGILRQLPYSAIESEVPLLSSLFLQTLDISGEEGVKTSTIDQLTAILSANGSVLEEHAGSLINRLSNISSRGNPPSLRAKGLQCLGLVATQLKTEVVLPFRKSVIKKLTTALDDGRRTVRTEAVKCRRRWIELDEAGDDDED